MNPWKFPGQRRFQDFINMLKSFLASYAAAVSRMSLEIHFLDSHLNSFAVNLGAVSDEQGEHFHQDIASMEHRFLRFGNEGIPADYCWMLYMDEPESNRQRKCKSKRL